MNIHRSNHYLKISIAHQSLEIFHNEHSGEENKPFASYKISSSKFGLGTAPGSFRTPPGKFIIETKIGHGAPERMIFQARKATGIIAPLGGEEDHVLTRILWLSGLESENANTRDRFIYIHGTNQEELLGSPASQGCIRLANAAMIELFDAVEENDLVEIVA